MGEILETRFLKSSLLSDGSETKGDSRKAARDRGKPRSDVREGTSAQGLKQHEPKEE